MKILFRISTLKKVSLLACATLLVVSFQNCSKALEVQSLSLVSTSPDLNAESRFAAVQGILSRNCTSCHSATSAQGSLVYSTEQEFVAGGMITPGKISHSKLIYRLQNYPQKNGSQNMPPTKALSKAEYDTLVSWVAKMTPDQVVLVCNPEENLLKPQIKRLTAPQFQNSLVQIFGSVFQVADFPTFSDSNPRIGLGNDPDVLHINEVNINGIYSSVTSLVTSALANNTTLKACVDASTDTCYATVISNFGPKLWRRPLTSVETADLNAGLAAITTASGTRTDKMTFLVTSLILSPNHLYRTELGSSVTPATAKYTLTQYEVASLLSFSILDAPPDDTLLEEARLNRLHNTVNLKAQVTRLTADSRFNRKLSNFIIDLLKIEDVKTVKKDTTVTFTTAERQALFDSALNTLNTSFSAGNANLLSPFKTTSFQINNQSSRFFAASGSFGASFTATTLPATERFGMLSHPAFLTSISGEIGSGIVRRGVFTLEQLLCYDIPAAPADTSGVKTTPVGFDPAAASTRENLTVTHSGQATCMGCHVTIDPAGFGYENYTNFGQYRMFEKGSVPIDASGVIKGITENPLVFSNGVTYFQSLVESSNFKSCLNKQFFKYATGQNAFDRTGQCEFKNFEDRIAEKPENTRALLESLVELDSFITRKPASK